MEKGVKNTNAVIKVQKVNVGIFSAATNMHRLI